MSPRQMSQRTLDRIRMIGPTSAAKITDDLERQVERQYRERILDLPPGWRITEGWRDICKFVTAITSIPYGSSDDVDADGDVHSHLTVLCMGIVVDLCKAGFLVPEIPVMPEREFVRTDKPAPGPRRPQPWD